jgi:hypothetical protein
MVRSPKRFAEIFFHNTKRDSVFIFVVARVTNRMLAGAIDCARMQTTYASQLWSLDPKSLFTIIFVLSSTAAAAAPLNHRHKTVLLAFYSSNSETNSSTS